MTRAEAAAPAVGTGQASGRWRLALVLMVTLFVGYLDRVNIALALPLMAEDLGWTDAELEARGELLFATFYVGYGLANILLSPLAARLGPRRSLIVIVVLWTVFTALGAFASQLLLVFAATRLLLGLSEGVHFPMMSMLTKTWFAPHERSRANGVWIAGLFLAVLLSPVILVPVMAAFGWRAGFWGLGLAGLLVTLPLVLAFVRDRPPGASVPEPEPRGRVSRLLRDPSFLLLLTAGILNNVVALGLSSWLPSFFVRTKGLAFEDLSWAVSLPYAGALVGLGAFAWLGDRVGRRALLAGGGYVAAGALVYLSLSADALPLVIGFFGAAVFCTAAYVSAEFALLQRVLPEATVGGDTGLYNGLTTLIGGGLGPFLVSSIVGDVEGGPSSRLLLVPAVCGVVAVLMLLADRRLRY